VSPRLDGIERNREGPIEAVFLGHNVSELLFGNQIAASEGARRGLAVFQERWCAVPKLGVPGKPDGGTEDAWRVI
jgi:hypothetical protein